MTRGVVFGPATDVLRVARREALPAAAAARPVRVRVPVRSVSALPPVGLRPPSRGCRGWSLGSEALPSARVAVGVAREVFASRPEAVDAVLGWLFSRFPRFGARGSDMVAHHAMLRDERYYAGWVELCGRLRLFERDR
jgi:hypothetical protein